MIRTKGEEHVTQEEFQLGECVEDGEAFEFKGTLSLLCFGEALTDYLNRILFPCAIGGEFFLEQVCSDTVCARVGVEEDGDVVSPEEFLGASLDCALDSFECLLGFIGPGQNLSGLSSGVFP